MSDIAIPAIDADDDTLTAALAYAKAGVYVGPVKHRRKDPRDTLGSGWPQLTSTDPQVIASWFAGSDHGVFVHAGRSGLVIFDVDQPEKLHPLIRRALDEKQPPYQTTRQGETERGHYFFAVPDGRALGNSLGTLASGWGEVRGRNGLVVTAPSVHQADDGLYLWRRTGAVPVLPDYLADALPDALDAAPVATDAEITTFLEAHQTATRPDLLAVHAGGYAKVVAAGESRHHSMTGHLAGAMKESAAGLLDAHTAADTLESVFLAAVAQQPCSTRQGASRAGAAACNEWAGLLAWAVAQARAADPDATRARVAEKVPPGDRADPFGTAPESEDTATSAPGERLAALGALLADLRTWQHLPDPTHVIVALAAAATRHERGEACWLLLVAPPSSGKTEAVRMFDDTADARLDEVTSAGLLGWSKGKTVRASGILTRVGSHALATFGDLSTLLATSDRGGRDQVFSHLRRVYDGHMSRDISPPGRVADGEPERLSWSGRLTVVACVTGAIDRYSAHSDQLGARWVYVRLPERDMQAKRHAAQLARRGQLTEHRTTARAAVHRLLLNIDSLPELPEPVADQIEDAALVTAWGRASVPRNGYGRRDIEGIPVIEEPMRLVQQLGVIARGVLALGLDDDATSAIVRRVALDSMPESRNAVLAALATGEVLTTSGVGRAADLDRKVARFQLEELAAVGVVTNDRTDDEDEETTGVVHWSLSGEEGTLIAGVFAAHCRYGGWDEKWVYTSTSPPERGETHTPSGGIPTLRPTPEATPIDTTTGPAECDTCSAPLLLRFPGRTTCGACDDQRKEAS